MHRTFIILFVMLVTAWSAQAAERESFQIAGHKAFVIEPLGLDRHPELRDDYFGHYKRLVYLVQVEDAALEAKARAAAERLGLAFEKRITGYGDLADFVRGV